MWYEIESLRRKRKSLILTAVGLMLYALVVVISMGPNFNMGIVALIVSSNLTFFAYSSLVLIILGVAFVDQFTVESVARINIAIILIGLISLFTVIPSYVFIGQALIIPSLAMLTSTSIPSSSVFRPIRSKIVTVGLSFKSVAVTLAVLWIVDKITNILVLVNNLFNGSDYLFYIVALSYIAGSFLESTGLSYATDSIDAALRNGVFSAFTSTLIMVIVVYILRWLGVLTQSWQAYTSSLIQLLIMSLVATILLSVISWSGSVVKFGGERYGKIQGDIYVLERNEEIDVGENVSFLAEKGTIIAKISTEVLGEKFEGVYLMGFGTYKVKSNGVKIVGSFDRSWIIYSKPDELNDLWLNLSRREATISDLNKVGFDSEEEFQAFISNEMKKVSAKMSEKSGFSHIKLPFIEIIESPRQDYVRIGPLTIIDSDEYTTIKFGPFKIFSDREINASFKLPDSMRLRRKRVKAYIGIQDSERGRVEVTVYPDRVELNSKETSIRAKIGELEITTDTTKLKLTEDSVKVVTPSIVLKAVKGKKAKLVVSDGPVIKVHSDGEIKIVKGRDVIRTYNPELAKRIIDRIFRTGEKIVKGSVERDRTSELEDLINYLERLLY